MKARHPMMLPIDDLLGIKVGRAKASRQRVASRHTAAQFRDEDYIDLLRKKISLKEFLSQRLA